MAICNCHLFYLLQITFKNEVGQYDLEVTTFQLAVLFAWNQRPREKISFENLKLATELPDAELRRTLWVGFFCVKNCVLSHNWKCVLGL
jgi:cullin-5